MGTADIDCGQGRSICHFILSNTQIINSLLSSTDIYITSEPVSDWTAFYGICCFLTFEVRFYGFELSNRMPTSLLIYVLVRTRVWVRLSLPQSFRSSVYVVKTQGNKKWGRSQWVCDGWFAGIAGSNPAESHRGLSPLLVVCCQVGVFATYPSFVHRSPTGWSGCCKMVVGGNWKMIQSLYIDKRLRWSRGSVLAFGIEVRGFKPGRSRRIFKGK